MQSEIRHVHNEKEIRQTATAEANVLITGQNASNGMTNRDNEQESIARQGLVRRKQ